MDANPYEPPEEVQSASSPDSWVERTPIVLFTVVSVLAAAASFAAPLVAVPAALLLVPAAFRTMRVRRLRMESGRDLDATNGGILILASLAAAIPVAIASLISFCCVCTPLGFVGTGLADAVGSGGATYGPPGGVLAFCLFVATWVALFIGQMLLRRWHYLSQEVFRSGRHSDTNDLA